MDRVGGDCYVVSPLKSPCGSLSNIMLLTLRTRFSPRFQEVAWTVWVLTAAIVSHGKSPCGLAFEHHAAHVTDSLSPRFRAQRINVC